MSSHHQFNSSILPFSGSHSSFCSSFTMITTHLIPAEKEEGLPMASVSTWGVKAWTGQSTTTRQGFVPLQRLSLCLLRGPMGSPWKNKALGLFVLPVSNTELGNTSGTFSSWPATGFAAQGLKCRNLPWMRNPLHNNTPKDCEDIQAVEKCLQSFSVLLLINAARGNTE